MKKHRNYLGLWLILACAFGMFAVASTCEPLTFGSHRLRGSGIVAALTPPAADSASAVLIMPE